MGQVEVSKIEFFHALVVVTQKKYIAKIARA